MTTPTRPDGPVYSGLWAILAGLLKTPRQPPRLPVAPGESFHAFHPAPGSLRYQRFGCLSGVVLTLLLLGGALGAPMLAAAASEFGPDASLLLLALLVVGLAALGAVAVFVGFILIRLNYDTTWYVMNDRSLRLRHGVVQVVEQTFTFENVQNVRVTQGPLQRLFGIADVVLDTAGGGAAAKEGQPSNTHQGRLAGLDAATQARDLILSRMGRPVGAGLGDDLAPGVARRVWSPVHLEALRSIRDELRSIVRSH